MTQQLDPDSMMEFLEWEQASRDSIDVKRVYVDLAGDLVTGILLSQIIFWFLPSQEGSKLRVEHDGRYWLAKLRADWWDECRISRKQFDRSITILKEKGLVETKNFMFARFRTLHIWLNINAVVEGVRPLLPKGEDRNSPKVKTAVAERVRPITETTNRDYLTEIESTNAVRYLKDLLIALGNLPYWIPQHPSEELIWVVEFLTEFPDFSLQYIKECRDFWDGRRAKNKGIWKSRLRNWMKKEKEFKARPASAATKVYRPRQPAGIPTAEELDRQEEQIGIG